VKGVKTSNPSTTGCAPLVVTAVKTYDWGSGSAKVWQPCTLAMAAGLTDHVWTLKEVLMLDLRHV
jgi:hypothetical protein